MVATVDPLGLRQTGLLDEEDMPFRTEVVRPISVPGRHCVFTCECGNSTEGSSLVGANVTATTTKKEREKKTVQRILSYYVLFYF